MRSTESGLAARTRTVLCCTVLAMAGAAAAGSLSADVQVTVKLVSGSGACGAVATEPVVQVACVQPGGPLLPEPGAVPYQRAGLVQALRVGAAQEPLPVYSDGTKISSWRVVQLDNARYIELTIAW